MKEINEIAAQIAENEMKDAVVENGHMSIPAGIDKIVLEKHGSSIEEAKRVFGARDSYLQCMAITLSEKGVELAKTDSTLERVSAEGKFVGDTASVAISRTKEYRNLKDPEGDKIVKHGVVDARYVTRGSNTKAGDMKKVVAKINTAWASLA